MCNDLDLVVLLGAEDVDVPIAISWDAHVKLARVLSKFISSSKVRQRFFSWTYQPHRAHGGMTLILGLSFIMGSFNLCLSYSP